MSRYLLYAIGEIILVVIGILIALQVNNLNQNRIQKAETKTLLENLKADIEEDVANFKIQQEYLKARKDWADLILAAISSQKVIDTTEFVSAMSRVGWIIDYSFTSPTYKEIVSSGKLSYIKSNNLKKALASYQAQVEENSRIISSYNLSLKETEKLAIGHIDGMPETSSSTKPKDIDNNVSFDLISIAEDREFLLLVKQISFQTAVTIDYIDVQLIHKAKQLQDLIDKELEIYS